MTQTYEQVTRQIAALQSKAEQLKKREMEGVIERIKSAIDAYGLTAEHLFGASRTSRRVPANGGKRVAKQHYADGKGNVWGGMGPRPLWLRSALEQGSTLAEFAVADSGGSPAEDGAQSPTRSTGKTKKRGKGAGKRGKKRAARQAYSNGTDTWSGFGRRPQWLQTALTGGANLDDMKVPSKD